LSLSWTLKRRGGYADDRRVDPSRLALVQGMDDTRAALRRWQLRPGRVVLRWTLGSLAISVGLLAAVLGLGALAQPDPTGHALPGLALPADLDAVGHILRRNALVLALHGMACVAGFIAGSSLPLQAEHHRGWYRTVHDHAGPLAIGFVVLATGFSLVTQALALGQGAATVSASLSVSEPVLVLTLLPHALLELVALFLPLAAWIHASRRDAWSELLAATVVTCALAVPVLVASACLEVYVWPHLLRAASPVV
jgi:hypothetical protein